MTQPRTSALIVVDMQNDYVSKGGYYDELARLTAERGGELKPADIEAMAQLYLHPPESTGPRDIYADLVGRVVDVAAATLAGRMTTFFVRTTYHPAPFYTPPLFLAKPDRKDYPCHPGSWGAELVDPIKELASHENAKVLEKHTFDAFFETGLRGLLRFQGIDTLYLAGVETNICVLCTALTALSNGFKTVILEDCVATSVAELHTPSLRIIEVAKGRRMTYQKFLASRGSAGGT